MGAFSQLLPISRRKVRRTRHVTTCLNYLHSNIIMVMTTGKSRSSIYDMNVLTGELNVNSDTFPYTYSVIVINE